MQAVLTVVVVGCTLRVVVHTRVVSVVAIVLARAPPLTVVADTAEARIDTAGTAAR